MVGSETMVGNLHIAVLALRVRERVFLLDLNLVSPVSSLEMGAEGHPRAGLIWAVFHWTLALTHCAWETDHVSDRILRGLCHIEGVPINVRLN